MSYELRKAGLSVETEVSVPVSWDGTTIDKSFSADFIVNHCVLIELKAIEKLEKVHFKQTLTYLKLTKLRLGMLIYFGAPLLKDGIHRVVNGL